MNIYIRLSFSTICFYLSAFSLLNAASISFVNFTPYTFTITFAQKRTPLPEDRFSKYVRLIKPWRREKICSFPKTKSIENKKGYIFEETVMSETFPQAKILLGQYLIGKKIGFIPISDLWWGLGVAQGAEPYLTKWFNTNRYTWDKEAYQTYFVLIDENNNAHHFLMRYRHTGDEIEYVLSGINLPQLYQTVSTEGSPEKINILSWNLYLMTKKAMQIFIGGTEADKPRVDIRSKLIADAIDPNYDVLVFSEAWDGDARKNLLTGLKNRGYRYATCILGSGYEWKGNGDLYRKKGVVLKQQWIIDFNDVRFDTDKLYTQADDGTRIPLPHEIVQLARIKDFAVGNGGIIIVSKWPIEDSAELIYSKTTEWEGMTKKGCIYTKINKEGKEYHIFGTHPQAALGQGIRKEQFQEFRKFINSLNIPHHEPVILAGDFNVNKGTEEFRLMVNILDVTLPKLKGTEKYTADHSNNLLNVYSGNKFDAVLYNNLQPSVYLDYVFYSNNHQKPKQAFNEIRVMTYGSESTPQSPSWSEYLKIYDLSDHYAIYAQMTF